MPGRKYNATASSGYRFGFNGKERSSEISSDDYDFGARVFDGRLGRWFSIDSKMNKYPNLSPYNFCANNPIINVDIDGRDYILKIFYDENGKGQIQIVYNVFTVSAENKAEIDNAMSLWKALDGTKVKLNDQEFNVTFITNTTQKANLDEAKAASAALAYSNVYGGNNDENGAAAVGTVNRSYSLKADGSGAQAPALELGPVAYTSGFGNFMWYKSITVNTTISTEVANATGKTAGTSTQITKGNTPNFLAHEIGHSLRLHHNPEYTGGEVIMKDGVQMRISSFDPNGVMNRDGIKAPTVADLLNVLIEGLTYKNNVGAGRKLEITKETRKKIFPAWDGQESTKPNMNTVTVTQTP